MAKNLTELIRPVTKKMVKEEMWNEFLKTNRGKILNAAPFLINMRKAAENKLEEDIEKTYERLCEDYEIFMSWIDLIQNHRNNRVNFDENTRKVGIRGQGHTKFSIVNSDKYEFEGIKRRVDESTGLKYTHVSLLNGNGEFMLTAFDQLELPFPGEIEISYKFNTEFFIGAGQNDFHYRGYRISSTDSVLKTNEYFGSENNRYFYEKDGEVYFRNGDALFAELRNTILRHFFPFNNETEFEGEIFLPRPDGTSKNIYSGAIKSDGVFPFWFGKDPNKNKIFKPKPVDFPGMKPELV